eukprot:s211_g12.t1
MGDDEIRFHLHTLAIKHRELDIRPGWGVSVFEPLFFHNWNDTRHILAERWCSLNPYVRSMGIRLVSAMCINDHWIPLWFVPTQHVLTVHTFFHEDQDIVDGRLRWIGLHLGFDEVVIHRINDSLPPHQLCGAHSIAFLAHVLLEVPLPASVQDLRDTHTDMRASFVQEIYADRICRCPVLSGLGGNGNLLRSLVDELTKHGVPDPVVESRAAQAIRAIGSEQLLQALQNKQPWRQLKALANNVNFKFVLPDELAAVVEANKMQSVGKRSKERPPPGLPGPIALDPAKLQVIEGTFRANGHVVPQLAPCQIDPISSGVVLMTAQDADPYLKSGQIVSKEPLALIVFHNHDATLHSMLSQTKIMVPCRCTLDNEPVLTEATMVQIGTGIVEKHSGVNLVTVETPAVLTLKVTVYRDECPDDWESFVKSPIRSIVSHCPELKRCMSTGCQCPAWHNDEALDLREPILDLWRRQFMKNDLKPCEANKATFFAVNIRVPDCLKQRILSRSGQHGIYIEPRTPDGKQVSSEFMVVWSHKHTLHELQHMKQTNPAVVGLTRVGDRRGLRVHTTQAEQVHKIVKPDTMFLPPGDRQQFTVGPFPYGLDRQAVSKIMKSAGWSCKPLQPAAPQPGRGAMWNVVAVEEPPTTIVQSTYGDILISRQKATEPVAKPDRSKPIAAASTLALCGNNSNSHDDPWSRGDPWGKYKPVSTAPVVTPAASDSLTQMEMRIQQAVLAKLPAQSMEQDDLPERLQALEGQFHHMAQKQLSIEQQFQDFSGQQTQQVTALQAQLNAQGQQLHGQIESQNQSIQAMFETQLAHIRGLLSKRPREDGECLFGRGSFLCMWFLMCIGMLLQCARILMPLFFTRGLGILPSIATMPFDPVFLCDSLFDSDWRSTEPRHLPQDWPKDIAQSSRIMAFTSLVDDTWVSGSVVYGEPESHLYPDRLHHTEVLLQAAFRTIACLSTGPRFIAGDWNVEVDSLPIFSALYDAGFKDLQQLAEERWAVPVRPTCKSRTRKDYCFVSPELQRLLTHVSIVDDMWPDHSVLIGHFQRLRCSVPRDIWKSPQPFPWPSGWDVEPAFWCTAEGSASDKYKALWKAIESNATAVLPFSPQKTMLGRACTSTTKAVAGGKFAPVRLARRGDFQPQFHGASFRHAQWIRQTRRIQTYMRSVRDGVEPSSHACAVWGSILRAKGFVPSFPVWWSGCAFKVHGAPASLPWLPPDRTVATALFDSVALAVRALEAELAKTSRQYAKCRRAANPHLIFQDIRQPSRNGVDFLMKPLLAKVIEVDAECVALTISPPQEWIADAPFFCNGVQLPVIHAEPDCIWPETIEGIVPGCPISQLRCLGTKEDLAHAFLSTWAAMWERHKDVPADRWETIIAFAKQFLPRHTMPWKPLDTASLSLSILQKKHATSGGMDGVSLLDLKSMPPGVLSNFCQMFSQAESSGSWPAQLIAGRVACVAKKDVPVDVMDFRPITVLGLLYRVWGTFHARRIIRCLDPIMPATLFGSRPSKFAGQVWSQTLWAIEYAQTNNVHLCGLIADLQKAFNFLVRLIVFEAAALLGIPLPCLTAWAGALSGMERRFQIGPDLTKPALSCTGFPEGDALSCVGMMIVDFLWHLWNQQYFPLCEPISYGNRRRLCTRKPAHLCT